MGRGSPNAGLKIATATFVSSSCGKRDGGMYSIMNMGLGSAGVRLPLTFYQWFQKLVYLAEFSILTLPFGGSLKREQRAVLGFLSKLGISLFSIFYHKYPAALCQDSW